MRKKLCSLILLAILLGTPILIETGKASTRPTVYVSPSSQTVPLGGHFKVDVDLDNASNLYGYEIWLSFDPSKVNATAIEYEGYLNEPTNQWASTINDVEGYIDFAISSTQPALPKNGGSPPPLVTINFTAIALGASPLHLNETKTILASSLNGGAAISHQTADGTVTVLPLSILSSQVGITGYKLLFLEAIGNSFSSPATIDYYWSLGVDKWSGTQWVATGISGSSTPVMGYTIPALTAVDLPYYVYLLPASGSNAVKWGDWLRISYTFHWTYSGTDYSTDYVAKLHVHPGDSAGKAVAFPYLGADGVCDISDAAAVGANWHKPVPPGTDPTSLLARADINGDSIVDISDAAKIGVTWHKTWTNSPPS